MAESGSLRVRVFVSRAEVPVANATVITYRNMPNGKHQILSVHITDESGVAGPITLDGSESMGLTPNSPTPFSDYQLIVEHPDYQLALFENLQIFPGVETVQNVSLIPLSPEGASENTTTVIPQQL